MTAHNAPGGGGPEHGLIADTVLRDWHFNMTIFRHAISGNICERDAMIAELGDLFSGGFWDRTRADLSFDLRDIGSGWERVPDWYALFHLRFEVREAAFKAELIDGLACGEGPHKMSGGAVEG